MENHMNGLAIHEASHFIIYIANCKRTRSLPEISEISINQGRGLLRRRTDYCPEIVASVVKSGLPNNVLEQYKESVFSEIKIILAGIAGELVQLGLHDKVRKSLSIFYKKEKLDPKSDLCRAIALHVALGCQNYDDGPSPLIKLLNDAISDVLANWEQIVEISDLLRVKKTIEGEHLKNLIAKNYYLISISKK